MKNVFISSTFTDLVEYRESVQKGLRQMGLTDISMENFGSRDERPKTECLRIIKEETDLFVGIYAYRYGFIPDGDDHSITQSEYYTASECKIPKLIYIVDDNQPWPPKFIENGNPAEKLDAFKKYLYSNHICASFSNKDNLTANVLADIGRTISISQTSNKVGKNIPIRNISMDSSMMANEKPIEYWNESRNNVYENNRGIFLTHVIKTSNIEGQEYDVFIYLIRHKSNDFSDIKYAEFFLGPYWGNLVFKATEETKGFIGISTSAYGTFLCLCRITFVDNSQIEIHRYIDFEAEKMK
jgi:hypothetical protein